MIISEIKKKNQKKESGNTQTVQIYTHTMYVASPRKSSVPAVGGVKSLGFVLKESYQFCETFEMHGHQLCS